MLDALGLPGHAEDPPTFAIVDELHGHLGAAGDRTLVVGPAVFTAPPALGHVLVSLRPTLGFPLLDAPLQEAALVVANVVLDAEVVDLDALVGRTDGGEPGTFDKESTVAVPGAGLARRAGDEGVDGGGEGVGGGPVFGVSLRVDGLLPARSISSAGSAGTLTIVDLSPTGSQACSSRWARTTCSSGTRGASGRRTRASPKARARRSA